MGFLTKDLTGKRFGRWLVKKYSHRHKDGHSVWECLCDCGNVKKIVGNSLGRSSNSCGCLRREYLTSGNSKHGMAGSPTYNCWQDLKSRCQNKNNSRYKDYGGRGINVCQNWLESFENFYTDMGDKPKGKSIDRINNDGNYEPSNCKWSTRKEQANNMRSNIFLTFEGYKLSISEWAKGLEMPFITLYKRKKLGWSDEKILMTP